MSEPPSTTPGTNTPGTNRQGRATRRALLDAGWSRVDALGLVDLLAGLRPGRVAAAAGRSAGSFRHHFPTPSDLVAAMVDDLVASAGTVGHATLSRPDAEDDLDLVAQIRQDAAEVSEVRHIRSIAEQRVGLVVSRAAVDPEAADAARRELEGRIAGLRSAVVDRLARFGREPIPPLGIEDVIGVSGATTVGLLLRRAASPAAVPDALLADLWFAEMFAFTREVGSSITAPDIVVELRHARGPLPDLGPDPGEAHGLAVVLEQFGHEWERGSLSEVAAMLGRPVHEVRERFGTVRRISAESFGACLDDVRAAAERHRDRDPRRALADVLVELARWAARFPAAARALLEERSDAMAAGGSFEAVPIDAVLLGALAAVAAAEGAPVTPSGTAAHAAAAVDLVLTMGATRERMSPVKVAELALCVVQTVPPQRPEALR